MATPLVLKVNDSFDLFMACYFSSCDKECKNVEEDMIYEGLHDGNQLNMC